MDLPQLKSRLPISSVMPRYGLIPDRNGMLCCPFHEDKTPSMQVSGESLYCHSTNCKHHGRHIDVIDFVMYKEELTKHEAILRCKALAGEPNTALASGAVTRASTVGSVDYADLYARLVPAVSRSSKARGYLQSRGLGELADVGYNPGTNYKKLLQCVVFGLRDESGEVASLYGRSIAVGKGKHFYTTGRRGLYPRTYA